MAFACKLLFAGTFTHSRFSAFSAELLGATFWRTAFRWSGSEAFTTFRIAALTTFGLVSVALWLITFGEWLLRTTAMLAAWRLSVLISGWTPFKAFTSALIASFVLTVIALTVVIVTTFAMAIFVVTTITLATLTLCGFVSCRTCFYKAFFAIVAVWVFALGYARLKAFAASATAALKACTAT